jgi:flagellar hook-length control protein FliK
MGWLEIKTQSNAGHVAASLVTESGEASAALAPHLPAIAQYLADHEVNVSQVRVEHQTSNAGGSGNPLSQQHGQDGSTGGHRGEPANAVPAKAVNDTGHIFHSAASDEDLETDQLSYISVRA